VTAAVFAAADAPGARSVPSAARVLTAREFRLFQALIYREAGIHLSEAKKVLVEGRLARRLRDLGLDFADYYRLVESDPRERVHMLDCICTNETHFFREPRQFEFLESQVFPEWRARAEAGRMARRVRVWSAGCSTGEEPYSVAMAFLAAFPPASGWEIDIVASDLSTRVLDRAQAAVWPIEKAREIPDPFLKAFMLRGSGPEEGRMKASPLLRARALPTAQPERGAVHLRGPVRPRLLPQRHHLLRRRGQGAGPGPPPRPAGSPGLPPARPCGDGDRPERAHAQRGPHRVHARGAPRRVSALARVPFVEVPTAAFALARAANRKSGLDAASLQAVLVAARRDIEDASGDLARAIERRVGESRGSRARRRERLRQRTGAEKHDG